MIAGVIMSIAFLIFILLMMKMATKNRCQHKWVKVDERPNVGTGTIIILQCEKCGDVKKMVI